MNESRAFATAVAIDSQFIYVFGGIQDYQWMDTIEKYDTLSDQWILLQFRMPLPIAKHGAALLEGTRKILIAGGTTEKGEDQLGTWQLDLDSIRWTKKANMKAGHLLSGGLNCSKGYVFALGGNNNGVC